MNTHSPDPCSTSRIISNIHYFSQKITTDHWILFLIFSLQIKQLNKKNWMQIL